MMVKTISHAEGIIQQVSLTLKLSCVLQDKFSFREMEP